MDRTTIADVFLELNLDKNVRIIDIACGTGAVAEDIATRGYVNIDGLDPMKGYLEVAHTKGLYKNYFANYVEPDKELPMSENTYDVMLCCAGFFQGLMSPLAFKELIRITKPGGFLIWNIAEGYEHYGSDYEQYDQIIDELRAARKWEYVQPIRRFDQLVFTDSGSAYLGGYRPFGLATQGFVYVMRKLLY